MRTSPRPKWTVLGTTNMEDFISRKTKERLVIIPLKPLDVNVISVEDQLSMEEQLAHASKYANQPLGQIICLNKYISSGEFAQEVYEDYIHVPCLQKMFDDRRVTSNHAILLAFFFLVGNIAFTQRMVSSFEF